MGLIKGDAAGTLAQNAVVLDLADLSKQAEAILSTARAEAERIVAEARAERARLLSDAEAVGRKAGHEAGLREGRAAGEERGAAEAAEAQGARLAALEAAWAEALRAFAADRDDLLVACKADVLRLAIGLAERVTHRVIDADGSVVLDQLASALREVGSPTRVTIAVAPGDAELVRAHLPGIAEQASNVQHAEMIEDASLAQGSCVVRTGGGGEIDATLRTQLDRLAELLLPSECESSAPEELEHPAPREGRGDLAA
ncbi:MAG: FliH/SctL family protein [Planctomycetota bacterium]